MEVAKGLQPRWVLLPTLEDLVRVAPTDKFQNFHSFDKSDRQIWQTLAKCLPICVIVRSNMSEDYLYYGSSLFTAQFSIAGVPRVAAFLCTRRTCFRRERKDVPRS